MRACLELLSIDGETTTVRVTDSRDRACDMVMYSDGSRSVTSGPAWLVDGLIRSGRKASDKNALREAVREARLDGKATLI